MDITLFIRYILVPFCFPVCCIGVAFYSAGGKFLSASGKFSGHLIIILHFGAYGVIRLILAPFPQFLSSLVIHTKVMLSVLHLLCGIQIS